MSFGGGGPARPAPEGAAGGKEGDGKGKYALPAPCPRCDITKAQVGGGGGAGEESGAGRRGGPWGTPGWVGGRQ